MQSFSPLRNRFITAVICLVLSALCFSSCSALSGDTKIGEGIVIAPVLKVRSTTAAVALDLAEIKRGERIDILDHTEVKTPTRVDEWYKVRTRAADPVTGWVEAAFVVDQAIVDKTEDLFQKSKPTASQGAGRLKVQTKLRVEPGGDVATLLSRGTQVDIVGKARTTVKPEKQNTDSDETTEEPEAKTILWYEVRLPDTEVLRAGWVGAQQVDLDVPDDIVYLEGEGRRFTGWVVFDHARDKKGVIKNDYIGLMKSLDTEGPIDFTRLWVLIYSPDEGHYIGPYIEDGLRGVLPVTLTTSSGAKGFTIHELDEAGKTYAVEYSVDRIDASHYRVKRLSEKIAYKKRPRR